MQGQSPTPEQLAGLGQEEAPINFSDYLRRAWRRKYILLIPLILIVGAGIAFLQQGTGVTTYLYTSEATLREQLPQFTRELAGMDLEQFNEVEQKKFNTLIMSLKNSVVHHPEMRKLWEENDLINPEKRSALDKAMTKLTAKLGFADQPSEKAITDQQYKELTKRLEVVLAKDYRGFKISFEAESRDVARQVIDKAARLFLIQHKKEIQSLAKKSRIFIDTMKELIYVELREVESQLGDLGTLHSDKHPDHALIYAQIYNNDQVLLAQQEELRTKNRSDIQSLIRRIYFIPWDLAAAATEGRQETSEQYINRLERAIKNMLLDKGLEHPDVRKLRVQVENAKKKLRSDRQLDEQKRREKLVGVSRDQLDEKGQRSLDRLIINSELELLTRDIQTLSGQRLAVVGLIKGAEKKLLLDKEIDTDLLLALEKLAAPIHSLVLSQIEESEADPSTIDQKERIHRVGEAIQKQLEPEDLEPQKRAELAQLLSRVGPVVQLLELRIGKTTITEQLEISEKGLSVREEISRALSESESDLEQLRKQYEGAETPHPRLNVPALVLEIQEGRGPSSRVIPKLEDITPEEIPTLNPELIDLLEQKRGLELEGERIQAATETLKQRIADAERALKSIPKTAVRLSSLRNQETQLSKQIEGLDARLATIRIRDALETDEHGRRLELQTPGATTPLSHSWPPPFVTVILICMGAGLGVGVLIITALEFTDHSFWRSDTVEKRLHKPVLAAIPVIDIRVHKNPKEAIVFRTHQEIEYYSRQKQKTGRFGRKRLSKIRRNNIATEQFRKLRLKLASNIAEGKPPRTIMITSAIPEEGKTTIAANLAVAISQRIGEHVLLVDCDMRRPSIHRYFDIEEGPGLSEYLQGDTDITELLNKTEFDKLTVLQAGAEAVNPAELLASQRMRNLVKEMKSRYADRVIIFDTSPILATAEPNVLASQVDGVMMVVEAGRTPREVVEKALNSLEGNNVLGFVLNGAIYEISSFFYPADNK